MSLEQQFRDAIKEAAQKDEEFYSLVCTVDAVREDFCDVTPLDGGAQLLDVRLVAQEGADEPFKLIPKEGSKVLVEFLDVDNAYIAMVSEVETTILRGDRYGGIVIVGELQSQLDIVTARIDTLYDSINNGVTSAQDGGATLLASMKTILATQVQTENFDDIENINVTHG